MFLGNTLGTITLLNILPCQLVRAIVGIALTILLASKLVNVRKRMHIVTLYHFGSEIYRSNTKFPAKDICGITCNNNSEIIYYGSLSDS